jgi:hypothetical protein
MERNSFDDYLAYHLKQELRASFPPADGKVKLLFRAANGHPEGVSTWTLFPKRMQNLYRVQVYRGAGVTDQIDCLMACYKIEFGMLNQQHLFS